MNPLWILLIAIIIVLGGILWLRLHAFVALLLAAFVVALLTPGEALRRYAAAEVERGEMSPQAAEVFVASTAPERLAGAFGRTCGGIGILIAMASIIGKCSLDSGAADRVVRTALRLIGAARAPVAFLSSSFVLSIPVFFDTVFYLMIPLAKAMKLRTGRNYLLYVLAILAGGTMAHSLVPPTPGPLLVADALGVNVGAMIIAGTLIGAIAIVPGFLYAAWANRRWDLPLRESGDFSLAEVESIAARDVDALPPLTWSVAPIVLPVVLIAGATALDGYLDAAGPAAPSWLVASLPLIETLGNKNVALMLAAALALGTLAWQRRGTKTDLSRTIGTALASGGVIVLITAAGGAFGAALRQSGIAGAVAGATHGVSPLLVLPMAFGVTAAIRTAQGSSTVAMITSVGLWQHLADPATLGFHPVYLAVAIGCGAKLLAWMNDSGFWIICKMSGMTEAEGLRTITPQMALMGVTGLLATMAAAVLVPMV